MQSAKLLVVGRITFFVFVYLLYRIGHIRVRNPTPSGGTVHLKTQMRDL